MGQTLFQMDITFFSREINSFFLIINSHIIRDLKINNFIQIII